MADKKNNNNSFLSAATMAGTAGGVYGVSKLGIFPNQPKSNSFIEATQQVKRPIGFSSKQEYLDFLRENAEFIKTPEGSKLAKQAWLEAVNTTIPNARDILGFTKNINQLPDNDIYSAIENTIQQNNSIYMGKTASLFRRSFRKYKTHYQVTSSVPNFIQPPNISNIVNSKVVPLDTLPKGIQGYVSRLQSSLGANISIQHYTRSGWAEKGFGTFQINVRTANEIFNISVPMSVKGVLAEGLTQSSMRIAPDVMLFDKTTQSQLGRLTRHEFLLENIEKSVVPDILSGKISGYEIQKRINELYEKNIYVLESIPNLPPNITNQALSNYTRIRGQFVDIRLVDLMSKDIYQSPDSKELMNIMRNNSNLYPLPSPSDLSKGRLSTYDPSNWFMTPQDIDYSRNPRQVLREWKASPNAAQSILRTKWSIFETQQWRQDIGHYAAPWFRTVWVNPEMNADLLEKWKMGEGESLLADTPQTRLQTRAFRAAWPANLRNVVENLEERIAKGEGFKPGEVLGTTVEGTPFTFEYGMKLKGLTPFSTVGKGNFYQLAYDEYVSMSESEKKFGHSKGMERFKNAQFTENIQRWISMDELKKDRSKHNTQMITALWDVMDQRMGKTLTSMGKRLYQNPTGFAKWARGVENTQEDFIKRLMQLATKEQFSPEEFGSVFGAVPYALGHETTTQMVNQLGITQEHRLEMFRGFAGGISQNIFGGLKAQTGAGALGSLEPRAFEILKAGHYGSLGDEISADLASRLVITNPERLSSYEALTKSLQSIGGIIQPGADDTIMDLSKYSQRYTKERFQSALEKGAFWLRTKEGPDVYVPSMNEISRMLPYKAASGEIFQGDIASLYHNYARQASRLFTDVNPITSDALKEELNVLTSALQKQQAPIGKGAGGFLGGKVLGSRFFTGVSKARGYSPKDIFTVGLSESYAQDMFEEMRETGLYNQDDIVKMQKQFSQGQKIGGVVARHPFIGQYSLQPINFELIRGEKQPVMALPSTMINLGIQGEEELNPIKLSPLVGMSGDLDADIFSAYLVEPKLSQKISSQFSVAGTDTVVKEAYIQHMIRGQLIKAKAVGDKGIAGISMLDKMIADAVKLGTAQTWVPQLSTELSTAKFAVGQNLKGRSAADARFLLEFLEQVPISGKHLSTQGVLKNELQTFFKTMQESLTSRNAGALESSIEGILQSSSSVTKRLLTEDINITEGMQDIQRLTGLEKPSNVLTGINLKATSQNIMDALTQAEDSGALRTFQQMAGRRQVTERGIRSYLQATTNILRDMPSKPGIISEVVSNTMEIANYTITAGKKIIKNPKVGYGFAGALALGMFLSAPKETIGPSSTLDAPKPNLHPTKAANRISPETMMAPHTLGQPSIPSQIYTPRSMIAPNEESDKIVIQSSTNRRINKNMLGNLVHSSTGGNVNINVRDNTSSNNIHVIANKLDI